MKFGKKTMTVSIAVSLALFLGACGNETETATEEVKEETTQTASQEKPEAQTEEKTETTETVAIPGLIAGTPMKDGTYTLTEKEYKNGYKVNFEIKVKDGKIIESNYDNVNEEGKSKMEDDEYQKNMSEKTGTGPKEFIPAFNEQLLEKQNAGDLEVVTGATHSFDSFMNYTQQLIQAAQKGDTTPIEIDSQAPLNDGEYSLTEKNEKNGYKVSFTMTVKDGKITESNYDNINEAGKSKVEDEEYQKNMSDKTGTGPKEFIPALNANFVKAQSAGDVEVVTGATHSWHTFKIYAGQLINAAQKGDTTPIEVDNFIFEKK
ncbi:extracellular electron transfer flavoprotein PplA [Niallia sp. Krafla_26]|uniref:extracellular electron transfer flavoprotein PplA n=1 Tax=Niallia sp. Krafla_26 TaxID=3064703 RepID=UPI003D174CF4